MEDYDDFIKNEQIFEMVVQNITLKNMKKIFSLLNQSNFTDQEYYQIFEFFFQTFDNKDDVVKFLNIILNKDITDETLKQMVFNKFVYSELEYLKIFIKNGIDPNLINSEEKTLLNLASASGEYEIVKYLLEECNADQLICDSKGRLPLYRCFNYHHVSPKIFFLLINDLQKKFETNSPILEILLLESSDGLNLVEKLINCTAYDDIFDNDIIRIYEYILTLDPNLKSLRFGDTWGLEIYETEFSILKIDESLNPIFTKCFYLFSRSGSLSMMKFFENLGVDTNVLIKTFDNEILGILSHQNLEIEKEYCNKVNSDILYLSLFSNLTSSNENNVTKKLRNPKLSQILNYYREIYFEYFGIDVIFSNFFIETLQTFFSRTDDFFVKLLDRESINLFFPPCFHNGILKSINGKILLEKGLDPNFRINGFPYITYLCLTHDFEMIELFLEYDVNLLIKSEMFDSKFNKIEGDNEQISPLKILSSSNVDFRHYLPIKFWRLGNQQAKSKILFERNKLLDYIFENDKHFSKTKKSQTMKYLEDPITYSIFDNPYIASDGNTYSKSTLEKLFKNNDYATSPFDRSILKRTANGDVGFPNNFVTSLAGKFLNGEIFIA